MMCRLQYHKVVMRGTEVIDVLPQSANVNA
jgi:hypothetical protein